MKFSELSVGRVFRTSRYDARLIKTRQYQAETLDYDKTHVIHFEEDDQDLNIIPEREL